MVGKKSIFAFMLLCGAFFLWQARRHAHERPQPPAEDKPKPAGASNNPIPLINTGNQDQDVDLNNRMTPDDTSLTGVENPTLGSPAVLHSYWVPGIQWSG